MTDDERRKLLQKLRMMVVIDFGMPNDNGLESFFCNHCIAHQALDMLDEVYDGREDQSQMLDDAAQDIIDRFNNQDPEIDNLRKVH